MSPIMSTSTERGPAGRRLRALEDLLLAGKVSEACDIAEAALAEGVSHAVVHRLVAMRLEEQGRPQDALAELTRGLELDPSNIDLVTTAGFCLLGLDRGPEAISMFRLGVALDPASDVARYGLGVALRFHGDSREAVETLHEVLRLNPEHALAMGMIAALAESRGDRQEARIYAERALARDPESIEAPGVMAKLAVADRDFATAEAWARASLARLEERGKDSEIRITLGDALDGLGRTEEAFEAYTLGKAEAGARHAGEFEGGAGRETAFQAAERALSEFLTTSKGDWTARPDVNVPSPCRGHAFLIGFPRSGTTLLENVLASHPGIATLEERATLMHASNAFLIPPGGLERLSQMGGPELAPFRSAYWGRVREFGVDPSRKVFVDKQPLAGLLSPPIAKLFPDAKVLFALRDPRDVVFSCFRRSFKMNPATYEFTGLERAARYYDIIMRAQTTFLAWLPLAVHEVRYERLVADFDEEAKAACEFLEVEWSETVRDFASTARARGVRTRSSNQVTQPLNRNGLAQWRRYERALEPVLPILQPWIERFGYQT